MQLHENKIYLMINWARMNADSSFIYQQPEAKTSLSKLLWKQSLVVCLFLIACGLRVIFVYISANIVVKMMII